MKTRRDVLALECLLAPGLITPAMAVTPKMDFNNDGRGDLAIGSMWATVNGKHNAGSVTVLYGTNVSLAPVGQPVR